MFFLFLVIAAGLVLLRMTLGKALYSSLCGILRCCCGRVRNAEQLLSRPPFCGPYAFVIPHPRLTRYDQTQGWLVVSDARGRFLKIRLRPEPGKRGKRGHDKTTPETPTSAAIAARRMKTWEVLQGQGCVRSYI